MTVSYTHLPQVAALGEQPPKDGAMPEVHPIEIANGGHAASMYGPEIMESANDSHGDLDPSYVKD